MIDFSGKKLLILAGASVHVKLAEVAKRMGIYTITADYFKNSPAKAVSDEAWLVDINNVDLLTQKCQEAHIDGIVCGWIDPAQRPYSVLCERLNLPCYGTYEQFFKMTDKHAFKSMCTDNNVGIITEYTLSDIENYTVTYPIFVKPVDSRGSRGQSICKNRDETVLAICKAKEASSNGEVIIENYIANKNSFQATYFFINGKPNLIRTADGYKGLVSEKLDRVAICSISPSVYTQQYVEKAHPVVINMLKALGIKNGPVMIQGFYDNGDFKFYDPGLRFPGVDYDRVYPIIGATDVVELMIEFALTGKISNNSINEKTVYLNGNSVAVLFPTISPGKICKIIGEKEIRSMPQVFSYFPRHFVGDIIEWTYNVNQRLCEIDIICNNKDDLINSIITIQSKLNVIDENGKRMIYCPFDTGRIM